MKFSHRSGEKRTSFSSRGSSVTELQPGLAFRPPSVSIQRRSARARPSDAECRVHGTAALGAGRQRVRGRFGSGLSRRKNCTAGAEKVTKMELDFTSGSIRHLGYSFIACFSKFGFSTLIGFFCSHSRLGSRQGYPSIERAPSVSRPLVIVHRELWTPYSVWLVELQSDLLRPG